MKELRFKKVEDVKKDELYVEIEFMSGDADAHETSSFKLPFKYTECNNNLEAIKKEIDTWILLEQILDCNSPKYIKGYNGYDAILEEYGQEIADMYECVPGDVTCCDYKQSISDISLIAFDEEGNRLECTTVMSIWK